MPDLQGRYPTGKWVHDRANRILEEGDLTSQYGDRAKSVAYALATQQAHKMGKVPQKGAGPGGMYGTKAGKVTAKTKLDRPKKEYRKTAALIPFHLGGAAIGAAMGAAGGVVEDLKPKNLAIGAVGGAIAGGLLVPHLIAVAAKGKAADIAASIAAFAAPFAAGTAISRLTKKKTASAWGRVMEKLGASRTMMFGDSPRFSQAEREAAKEKVFRHPVFSALLGGAAGGIAIPDIIGAIKQKTWDPKIKGKYRLLGAALGATALPLRMYLHSKKKTAAIGGQDLRSFKPMTTPFPTDDSKGFAQKLLNQGKKATEVGPMPSSSKLQPKSPSIQDVSVKMPSTQGSLPKIGSAGGYPMDKFDEIISQDPLVQHMRKEAQKVMAVSEHLVSKGLQDTNDTLKALFSHPGAKKYTDKKW